MNGWNITDSWQYIEDACYWLSLRHTKAVFESWQSMGRQLRLQTLGLVPTFHRHACCWRLDLHQFPENKLLNLPVRIDLDNQFHNSTIFVKAVGPALLKHRIQITLTCHGCHNDYVVKFFFEQIFILGIVLKNSIVFKRNPTCAQYYTKSISKQYTQAYGKIKKKIFVEFKSIQINTGQYLK